MTHGKKVRLDKCQRLMLKHADRGQRLEIIVPIIIRKLERLGDPYSVNVIELLKDYLAPASSEEWQKKVRQVKLYRSLERYAQKTGAVLRPSQWMALTLTVAVAEALNSNDRVQQ